MPNSLEVGTIVRVLSINDDPQAVGPDAWGVVVHDPAIDDAMAWGVCAELLKWTTTHGEYNSRANANRIGWYLHKREYKVVPDDEVPDEIWVELARMRLVGDQA